MMAFALYYTCRDGIYPVLFWWFFLGGRQSAVELSLFAAKKRRKNRHRFEAVDADQGCGPGPGVCGHLTTAYSPGWGPVNKVLF